MDRKKKWRTLATSLAALALAGACVDLDSLGSGGVRPGPQSTEDAGDAAVRFCAAHADDLFCDDFDDPGPPGQKWPGIASVLPSPSRFGKVSFVADAPDPPSSAPFAVAFEGTRGPTEGRPFVAFAKELTSLRSPAVAISVDVKIVSLEAVLSDAGTDGATLADASGDAEDAGSDGASGDADASGDASGDAANGDAASPANGGLPPLRVPIVGMVSIGQPLGGVQVVASREGLFVVVGLGEATLVRARVSELDYVSAASLAWTRITLAVGDPASVEAFAIRETKLPVTCPRTTSAVAVWPTLPPNTIQCVPGAPGYADTPERRLAATVGIGLESPSTTRVLVDSVRVVAIPAP